MSAEIKPKRKTVPEWITWEILLSQLSEDGRKCVEFAGLSYLDHSATSIYFTYVVDDDCPDNLAKAFARDIYSLIPIKDIQFVTLDYYAKSREFTSGKKWRIARYATLLQQGNWCRCCGRKPPAVVLNVDHIVPRSIKPELAYDLNNLQVLCEDCNLGKGNTDSHDWRSTATNTAAG